MWLTGTSTPGSLLRLIQGVTKGGLRVCFQAHSCGFYSCDLLMRFLWALDSGTQFCCSGPDVIPCQMSLPVEVGSWEELGKTSSKREALPFLPKEWENFAFAILLPGLCSRADISISAKHWVPLGCLPSRVTNVICHEALLFLFAFQLRVCSFSTSLGEFYLWIYKIFYIVW